MVKIIETLPTFQQQYKSEKEMKELGIQRTSKRRQSHIARERGKCHILWQGYGSQYHWAPCKTHQ